MLTSIQSALIAVFIQALLYGVYFATLIQSFRWLIFTDEGWKPRKRINYRMAFATIFIFLVSTINLTTSIIYELKKNIRKDKDWNKFGIVMVTDMSEILGIIAVDGVLIYRCWLVYARSWRIICLPVAFWLTSLTCAALIFYFAGVNNKGQTSSPEITLIANKVQTCLYGCNISTTVYSTTAIIYRIRSRQRNGGRSSKRLNYAMRILAESGILYTSTIIFSLIGTLLASRSDETWEEVFISYISDPINFATGGITFNLILIRVYQSRTELWDNPVVSKDQTLSGIQSESPQITATSEEQPSTTLDKEVDEMQEHSRSQEGVYGVNDKRQRGCTR